MSNGAKRAIIVVVLVGLALAAVAAGLWWQPWRGSGERVPAGSVLSGDPGVVLQGRVQSAGRQAYAAPADGKVIALGANELGTIAAGQLIAQVSSPRAKQRLAEARAHLAAAKARVERAERSQIHPKLRAARTRWEGVLSARKHAETALAEFKRTKPTIVTLLQNLAEGEDDARTAQQAYDQLKSEADALQAKANATGQPDPGLAALQARLEKARGYNNEAQATLAALRRGRVQHHEDLARFETLQKDLKTKRAAESREAAALRKLMDTPDGRAALAGDAVLKEAQERVTKAEALVAACEVKAKAPGIVAELMVRPGSQVKAGDTLAVVEQSDTARLVFTARPEQMSAIRVGQRAQVSVGQGQRFRAKVAQFTVSGETALVYLQTEQGVAIPAPGTLLVARLYE